MEWDRDKRDTTGYLMGRARGFQESGIKQGIGDIIVEEEKNTERQHMHIVDKI